MARSIANIREGETHSDALKRLVATTTLQEALRFALQHEDTVGSEAITRIGGDSYGFHYNRGVALQTSKPVRAIRHLRAAIGVARDARLDATRVTDAENRILEIDVGTLKSRDFLYREDIVKARRAAEPAE